MNNFEEDLVRFAHEAKRWYERYNETEGISQEITMSLMDMMVAYDLLEEHIEKLKTDPNHTISDENWEIVKRYRREAQEAYKLRCKKPPEKPLLTRWYVKNGNLWHAAGLPYRWEDSLSKATSYCSENEAIKELQVIKILQGAGDYSVVSVPE